MRAKDAKQFLITFVIAVLFCTAMVGCDAEGEDFFDDMADLVKELVTVFLQWLMEG